MRKLSYKLLATAGLSIALASCGGSSGGSPAADGSQIRGVLVVPEAASQVASDALNLELNAYMSRMDANACPDVPAGYEPLVAAVVNFVDANSNVVGTSFTTDTCGTFNQTRPATATGLQALGDGYRPIMSDLSVFTEAAAGGVGIASTIADTATYQIGAIQALDDQRLGFTVTDTQTNQAVLGIPASAFSVLLDGANSEVGDVRVAASTNSNASAIMTLDASGSMGTRAFTDEQSGESFNRFQLAARAAHTFLDQKAPADEVAAMIFSSSLFFMNQETLDAELSFVDTNGNVVPYQLSDDGFLTDSARMRLVVDAYNRDSDLYSGRDDIRHPDTPANITVDGRYPFGGATALFDAIGESIAVLNNRGSARPVVVAMTDGSNNSSVRSEQDVINEAIAANIPVYTIGFATGRQESLTRIAEQTGGSFFAVESLDIANAYQAIQTGITFQYIATLPQGGVSMATSVTLALDFNQLQTQRELTLFQ